MSDDLETRVAILEVKGDHQAEKFDKIEISLKETHGMVFSIKERLDRQNGLIPHMAEDMKVIKEHYDKLSDKQSNLSKEQTKDGTKLHLLWGIAGTIGGGIATYVIKLLVGH